MKARHRGERHSDGELQHLLAQAGAIVSLDQIAAWKRYEFAEASTWVEAQLAANARCPKGHRISVRWPSCVAIAVYGRMAIPTRRTGKRGRR